MLKRYLLAIPLFIICACAAGCARPYASHLPHAPWTPGVTQSVSTKTLDFTYEAVTNRNLQGIRGSAALRPGSVPDWGAVYERIVLKVYLSDDTGRIIDTYTLPCLPRPVREPVSFEIFLDIPADADRESYFLAFGYSLVIRGEDPDSPKIIRQEEAGF